MSYPVIHDEKSKCHLLEYIVSLCVSSLSRPRILVMEKSVSFLGLGGLSDNSSDFPEHVESTTETSDLEQKFSIITELINLLQ